MMEQHFPVLLASRTLATETTDEDSDDAAGREASSHTLERHEWHGLIL